MRDAAACRACRAAAAGQHDGWKLDWTNYTPAYPARKKRPATIKGTCNTRSFPAATTSPEGKAFNTEPAASSGHYYYYYYYYY